MVYSQGRLPHLESTPKSEGPGVPEWAAKPPPRWGRDFHPESHAEGRFAPGYSERQWRQPDKSQRTN
jgi:hypothetical protein